MTQVPRGEQGAALANEVEGYLLLCAERDQALREAQTLCARLPWLTSTQAEDITDHYVQQRLEITRQMLRTVAGRAEQLRSEYEARYAALRRSLLKGHAACAAAVLACATGTSALASILAR
ncbi:hypothetical protein [Streptomyces glomeratus]|uniref:Cytochrome C oxidase subunit I n=1 Tax=Streptomyces glomeratus TaxID=284452 RepID=A0ABP6LZ02_9ACTN|nr:hypothetical protein [Streptomyces glomeratus]MCF1512732.1 hypothetical protein [Streptomyces glomeratus]